MLRMGGFQSPWLCAIITFYLLTMKARASIPIRVLTQNIRYNATSLASGEKPWSVRAPIMLNEFRFNTLYNPEAFISCQEVLKNQLDDILNGLNSAGDADEWTYIGVGRNDGKTAGEYSPIFYRPAVWKLEFFETKWVSPTPDVPSKHPNASSIRIVTIGKFSHIKEQRSILALNTHLDDQGSLARLDGAKLIANLTEELSRADNGTGEVLPVFVTGDFNSEPSQEAYRYMVDEAPFTDVYDLVPVPDHYGNNNTWTGFAHDDDNPEDRIDFVFIHYNTKGDPSTTPWSVKSYAVLSNKFDFGIGLSDHRAVVADLVLN